MYTCLAASSGFQSEVVFILGISICICVMYDVYTCLYGCVHMCTCGGQRLVLGVIGRWWSWEVESMTWNLTSGKVSFSRRCW